MKKLLSALFILSVCLSLVSTASADSVVPGGDFASSMTVQNLGDSTANVTGEYIDVDGGEATQSSHEIPVEDVLFIYFPNNSA